RLTPEPVLLPDKHHLYRHAEPGSGIGIDNYETYFLLAVDRELSDREERAMASFLDQYPEKKDALALLLQTRLPDEPLVFADKSLLYRSDRKTPIVYLSWKRWAAAAVIAGLAFSVWMLSPDAGIPSRKNPVAKTPVPLAASPAEQTVETSLAETGKIKPAAKPKEPAHPGKGSPVGPENAELVMTDLPAQTPPAVQQQTEKTVTTSDREIKAEPVTAAAEGSFETKLSRTTAVSGNNPVVENLEPPKSYAKQVVYRELDTDTPDEDRTLLVGSLQINKDKLRGLFRKAASLLHSKNKSDDEHFEEVSSPKKARSLK
ncbi:MAG TPA: hypothetical protein VG842_12210, partial [Sediminibacterium sp.]|nr:hypothetical protein [Sediminibacterium sp.]